MLPEKHTYIDRKKIRHTVKHEILPGTDPAEKERILEDIRTILLKQTAPEKRTGQIGKGK